MAAPNQDERRKCWDARDVYWNCLDSKNGDKRKCQEARKKFEESCSGTWVKYFDRRYDYLKFKARMEKEGYEPVQEDKS